jgi:hypothetical protein
MGWNELHQLAVNNDAAEIKESVLGRGTIVRERTELTGMMPIHKACMYGRYAAFLELYELGTAIRHVNFKLREILMACFSISQEQI